MEVQMRETTGTLASTAMIALQMGISVIPIHADGTKRPVVRWKFYQEQRATPEEVRRWFSGTPYGLACITGAVSGGLELLDFDSRAIYEQWARCMRREGAASLLARIESGYQEASPNGIHLLYRSREHAGNQVLARAATRKPSIETRGEGGYGIIAPSCGRVHPSGRPYQCVAGRLTTIQTITPQERRRLFVVARAFDEAPRASPPPLPVSTRQRSALQSGRPGDRFNAQGSWEDLLPRYGWVLVRYVGEEGQWRRPGKETGISATTNYQGSDLLYVFSSSTCFESRCGYSKFHAYTILAHEGNFSAAAKVLARQGYGKQGERNRSCR